MSDVVEAQALAAMRRCVQVADGGGPLWSAAGAVSLALEAMEGSPAAAETLATDPAWQLDERGNLPTENVEA